MKNDELDAATVERCALEAAKSWIERWTSHVGNCRGGNECTCGRTGECDVCSGSGNQVCEAREVAGGDNDNLSAQGWKPLNAVGDDWDSEVPF